MSQVQHIANALLCEHIVYPLILVPETNKSQVATCGKAAPIP